MNKSRKKERRRRAAKRSLAVELLESRELLSGSVFHLHDPNLQLVKERGPYLHVNGDPHGDDTIVLSESASSIRVVIETGSVRVEDEFDKQNANAPVWINLLGYRGNDLIVNNTSLPMKANGGDGDDTIYGGSGDDTLIGDLEDRLNGSDPQWQGRLSRDELFGRDGDDILYGDMVIPHIQIDFQESRGESDLLSGGSGVDKIWGGGGDDELQGDDGNDFLYGGWDNDIVDGGHGHDELWGGADSDTLFGASGNDQLIGQGGDDFLYGHRGNDDLYGDIALFRQLQPAVQESGAFSSAGLNDGHDFLVGGDGDDYLDGWALDDELHGGRGADSLFGSTGNDTLYGGLAGDSSDGGDDLRGDEGDDIIYGSGGNDTIFGGAGNDTAFGEQGDDRIGRKSSSSEEFDEPGDDLFDGGPGNDIVRGGAGNDVLKGGYGSDIIIGGSGNDNLQGGIANEADGDDVMYGDGTEDRPAKVPGDDTLTGHAGNDQLKGGPGRDGLYGNDGNDTLLGEDGNDTLFGHEGDDFLKDSAVGINHLDGGPGVNEVVFSFGKGLLHAEILPGDGKLLSLAGTDVDFPGSGFTLEADNGWTSTQKPGTANKVYYEYSASGNVFLHTATAEPILVAPGVTGGLTIRTREIENTNHPEKRAVVDPSSLTFTFDIGAWINDNLTGDLGIKFDFPSLSVGIKSGGDLRNDDSSMPLRDNQPYVFAQFDTNLGVKFGGIEIAPAGIQTTDIKIIVDPTDPFVYLKSGLAAAGVSVEGRAQFHPNVELVDYNDKADVIYGHVAMGLDGIPLPYGFSLNGNAVVDFDANDNGEELNGAGGGPNTWFDTDAFLARIDDVSLGVNGELEFGPRFAKSFLKFLDIGIKVGNGAVVFDGHQEELHFRGETANLFADTPLEDWPNMTNEMEISGSWTGLDSDDSQFRLDASYRHHLTNSFAEFHADNDGAEFFGTMNLLGQKATARGEITSAGEIEIEFHSYTGATIKLGGINFSTGAAFDITILGNLRRPSLYMNGSVDVFANAFSENGDYGLAGRVTAELEADFSSAAFLARAEVTGSLTVKLGFIDYSFDVSAAAQISDSGLTIWVNGTPYTIDWSNGSSTFSGDPSTDLPKNGRLSNEEQAVTPGGETMDTTPTLEWNKVQDADGQDAVAYELWVNNVTTGASAVIHETGLNGTKFTAGELARGRYRVWTRPRFAAGEIGSWSQAYDFHIVRMRTPKLDPFGRETTDPTPEFAWFSAPDATRYELWVDNLSTGTSRVIHETDLPSLTHTPKNDLLAGRYRAWVRAHGNGVSSKWSAPYDFNISAVGTPHPTLCLNGSTNATPRLEWTHVSGAKRYELWVNNVTTGTSALIHESIPVFVKRNDELKVNEFVNEFTPKTPLPAGDYRMWVRAFDRHDQPSAWSSAQDFTIAAPDAPEWFGPNGEIADKTPTLRWLPVSGAVQYELWVDNNTSGHSQVIYQTGLSDPHFTGALPAGSYTAWVRAHSTENGSVGLWSAPHQFEIVNLLTPVLDALPSSTTNTKPTISWNESANAVRYEIWVNNVTTGQSRVIHETDVSATSFTPAQHLSLGTHRVWVRTFNAAGEASKWSQPKDFTIAAPAAPQVSAPAGDTTDATPTFQWNAVGGAAKYELWVNNVSTGESRVIHETDLTSATHTAAENLTLGTYRVWVRAFNSAGQAGAWSRARDFTIVAPAAPQLSAPSAETVGDAVTFTWNQTAGAASYELWVNNLSTGESRVIHDTNVTETSYTPANPLPVGTYAAWVRAFNSGGEAGKWSQVRTFVVLSRLPAPQLNGPSGIITSIFPQFSWDGVPGAARYELWVDNLTSNQTKVIHRTNLAQTHYTHSSNLLFNQYRFRVRAFTAGGDAGDWSDWMGFQISPF